MVVTTSPFCRPAFESSDPATTSSKRRPCATNVALNVDAVPAKSPSAASISARLIVAVVGPDDVAPGVLTGAGEPVSRAPSAAPSVGEALDAPGAFVVAGFVASAVFAGAGAGVAPTASKNAATA